MTDLALTKTATKETSHALIILAALLAVAVVVAGVYVFGYPLLILLADSAAMSGILLIVALTLMDLLAGRKRRKA